MATIIFNFISDQIQHLDITTKNKLLLSHLTLPIPNNLSRQQQVSLLAFKNNFTHNVGLRSINTLTHTTDEGKATMVDVGDKTPTKRTAKAQSRVHVGKQIYQLIRENQMKKGDVLTVAQLAGIIAAKKTSDLIPLCHNILLSSVNVVVTLSSTNQEEVVIESTVNCEGKTGVEMEALCSCAVSALTVYDMCKAVSHEIVIKDIRLLEKTGGKSHYRAQSAGSEKFKLNYDRAKIVDTNPFSPSYV